MNKHSIKSLLDIRRTSGVPQKPYGPDAKADGEEAVGQRDGVWMKAVPSKTSRAAGRSLRAGQNPVGGRSVKLGEHRARAEQPIKAMPLEDIASRAKSMNIQKSSITQAARRILDGQDPGLADSTDGDTTRLLAYHLALHCLSPHIDRRGRAALLTPQGPFTSKPQETAAHFRDLLDASPAGEELEALAEAVIKVKGGRDLGRDAIDRHKPEADRLRRKLRRDGDDAALDELAEWLAIPPVDADRDERCELEVRNNLAGFTTDNKHGQRALRNINTDRVAQTQPDPPTFQRSYGELSEQATAVAEQSPVQVLLVLLRSYSAEQLPPVIGATLAAASDDMNADNPSNEANRLHATVQKLGDGFVGNTVVPRFKLATKRVNHFMDQGIVGAPAA